MIKQLKNVLHKNNGANKKAKINKFVKILLSQSKKITIMSDIGHRLALSFNIWKFWKRPSRRCFKIYQEGQKPVHACCEFTEIPKLKKYPMNLTKFIIK